MIIDVELKTDTSYNYLNIHAKFMAFRIGLNISTKAIGKFEREDITEAYKFPESKCTIEFYAKSFYFYQ